MAISETSSKHESQNLLASNIIPGTVPNGIRTISGKSKSGQWNSGIVPTQLNEHLWMQGLKHLSVHIYLVTLYIKYFNQLDSRTDLSPIPVRSAVKSYITSWCIQNLSKRALYRQTVSTSITKLGRLFQMLFLRYFCADSLAY